MFQHIRYVKTTGYKMHEQQKGQKVYNTCNEKQYHTTTNV